MPAEAGIQGGRGWIPAFAGMTDASYEFVAQIVPAQVFSKKVTKVAKERKKYLLPNFVCFSVKFPLVHEWRGKNPRIKDAKE